MSPIFVDAIGLAAPGLVGWQMGRSVLAGDEPFKPQALDRYKPKLLPANERRRATNLIRLAFQAGEDAVLNDGIETTKTAAIFASSGGDYDIIDKICRVFSGPDRAVSPTQFHNSVHNSAAGYWSIATGSRAPSSSLSAFDFSFSAGLLEAVCFVTIEKLPTLLVVYDISPPPPLSEKRPVSYPFGSALLLSPQKTERSCASLTLRLVPSGTIQESTMHFDYLESVRMDNPAARCLPLLELLACRSGGLLAFCTAGPQFVTVDVVPC